MKILKKVLIVLLIIIAIPFIAALFVDGNFLVERQVTINRPAAQVYDYIKFLKNQELYSVWYSDTTMKKNYEGIDGTVGFKSSWESTDENIGAGSQTITALIPGKRMDTHLSFIKPFESEDDCYITTDSIAPSETKVTWGYTGKMPYPFNLMKLFYNLDEAMGKDLGKGLENLKVILEKQDTISPVL